MNATPEGFQFWQELAEGESDRQIIRIIDVATHLGVTPIEVVKLAIELKRETDNRVGRPTLWINAVPYFDMLTIAAMELKLRQRAETVALGERSRRN